MMRSFSLARDIEQEYAHEDGEEAAKERNGVDGSGSVEALKENCRGDDCGC